ncbi:MAG: MarR family transcriptional regulator [Myxococcota bacterium]
MRRAPRARDRSVHGAPPPAVRRVHDQLGRAGVHVAHRAAPQAARRHGRLPAGLLRARRRARARTEGLAEAAGVDPSTMTATLRRMERDGLIARRADPADGRSTLVALSARGRALVPAVVRATEEVNAMALAPLSAEEREHYLGTLAKIIAALSADGP